MNVLLNNSFFLPRQNYSPVFFSEKTPHFGLCLAERATGFRAQSQGISAELCRCTILAPEKAPPSLGVAP